MSPGGYGNLTRAVPGYGHCRCFEHTWMCRSRRRQAQQAKGQIDEPELPSYRKQLIQLQLKAKRSRESTLHVSPAQKYGTGVLYLWAFNCLLNAKPFEHRKPDLQSLSLSTFQSCSGDARFVPRYYTVKVSNSGGWRGNKDHSGLWHTSFPSWFVSVVLPDSQRLVSSPNSQECLNFKKRLTQSHSENQTMLSWLCTSRSREQQQALPLSSGSSLSTFL